MEEKRLEIIESSLKLFCQYGIKSISMDDIARELGMSKKTLYQHIDDKNKLVEEALQLANMKDIEVMAVFKRPDLNAIEQFFEFKKLMEPHIGQYQPTILFDLKKYYPALLYDFKEKQKEFIMEAYIANIKKGKQEGLYHEDIIDSIIARLLLAHHLFTFDDTNGLFTVNELREMELFSEVFKYHFRGVCTEKGMQEVDKLFCEKNYENK
ncbi:TetR/AcrR family transcriptional regulator [Carboxylicivirga mesophila]|uniref:TetR/AcrR family transcriptional regulator n=1 Tax=Carboxylicivirga mesophila TaxID=1166478 RepID=A0ABS5K577_9BACT|nr:TetR/AcrR family transcriptional regulator [Carboxylicivirga mesophila]MBS2210092.1 TetR/AcrR family transcriptional regulator [Carboxylicivirga mesophila]